MVEDLPGLLTLPDAKHNLVVMVLRRKSRAGHAERGGILDCLRGLQRDSDDGNVQARAKAFLDETT